MNNIMSITNIEFFSSYISYYGKELEESFNSNYTKVNLVNLNLKYDPKKDILTIKSNNFKSAKELYYKVYKFSKLFNYEASINKDLLEAFKKYKEVKSNYDFYSKSTPGLEKPRKEYENLLFMMNMNKEITECFKEDKIINKIKNIEKCYKDYKFRLYNIDKNNSSSVIETVFSDEKISIIKFILLNMNLSGKDIIFTENNSPDSIVVSNYSDIRYSDFIEKVSKIYNMCKVIEENNDFLNKIHCLRKIYEYYDDNESVLMAINNIAEIIYLYIIGDNSNFELYKNAIYYSLNNFIQNSEFLYNEVK